MSHFRYRDLHARKEAFASFPSRLFGLFCGSLEAFGLFAKCLAWSASQKEDGWVPRIIAERCAGSRMSARKFNRLSQELLDQGLFDPAVPDGKRRSGDFVIPFFATYNATAAEIEAERTRGRERQKGHRLRPSIIQRDGLVCRICGGAVEPHDVHVDHIHPVSRGGRSEPSNLRVTHRACNLAKGAS
jgi:hypothetical protein